MGEVARHDAAGEAKADPAFWGLDRLARPCKPLATGSAGTAAAEHSERIAGFSIRHLDEALRQRLCALFAEVLPAVERNSHLGFSALFGALAASEVFRELYAGPRRQPFLLPSLPFVADLLTLPEMAHGLSERSWSEGVCPYSSALFIHDGKHVKSAMPLPAVESEELMRECIRYGTIMVMHSGNHWKKLGKLALASVQEFQIPTNNTIFLTDGDRQHSLNVHNDNHNVLLLQTGGQKRWIVWNPPKRKKGPDPLARGKHYDDITPDELEAPIMDVDLLPGQALCIPFGFPHVANTLAFDEPSLHVTLSMYPTPTYASMRRELLVQLGTPEVLNDEDMSDEAYWRLTSFVPVGCLAPSGVRNSAKPGPELVQLVVAELCARVAGAEPSRFLADEAAFRASACDVVVSNLRGLLNTLDTYEHGFRVVATAEDEFPALHPREMLTAFSCGDRPGSTERKRVDPEDGVERSKAEVVERYSGSYDVAAIEEYWRDQCTPVMAQMDGEPARIDPADGAPRTLSDLKKMHRFTWTPEQIDAYWHEHCRSIYAGDTLPTDHIDRVDRAASDARELIALLRDRMPHLRTGRTVPGDDGGEGQYALGQQRSGSATAGVAQCALAGGQPAGPEALPAFLSWEEALPTLPSVTTLGGSDVEDLGAHGNRPSSESSCLVETVGKVEDDYELVD